MGGPSYNPIMTLAVHLLAGSILLLSAQDKTAESIPKPGEVLAESVRGRARLRWSSPAGEAEGLTHIKIQRRASKDKEWATLAKKLTPRDRTYLDEASQPGSEYRYEQQKSG